MKYHDNGRNRITGRRILSALLVLSMVFTTGSSPVAVAEAADTHRHNESCYEKVLTCPLEEGHIHGEECYGDAEAYVCGKEESKGHTHTDECRDESGAVVCGLEEHEGHVHDDSCRGTISTLECSLAEGGHRHADSCYTSVLICRTDASVQGKSADEDISGGDIGSGQEGNNGDGSRDDGLNAGTPNPGITRNPEAATEQESSSGQKGENKEDNSFGTDFADMADRVLVCKADETEHTHTYACYVTVVCGSTEHEHGENCYDADEKLNCGLEEHIHSEECCPEHPAYCGLEEHIHTDKCYNEEYTLLCEIEEHVHKMECYRIPGVSEEDQARIEQVSRLIADMPAYEEIMEQIEACGDDEEAYYETLMTLMSRVMAVYEAYQTLEEDLRQYVIGAEGMLQLVEAFEAVLGAETLALYDPADYGYYNQWQINGINTSNYAQAGDTFYPILVQGSGITVYEALGTEYIYEPGKDDEWVGVVMRNARPGEQGPYYVTKILNAKKTTHEDAQSVFKKEENKLKAGEFMVLFHELPAVEAGDRVILSFGYTWTQAEFLKAGVPADPQDPITKKNHGLRNSNGLGLIVICNNMACGEKTDDRSALRKLGAEDGVVSTDGLITVNLYDYTTADINKQYRGNSYYPFFKSSAGVDGNSYADREIKKFGTLGFGDTVVADDPTGQTSIVQEKADINAKQPNNMPVNKNNGYSTVADSLVNGFPAVKENNGSLSYLFDDSVKKGSDIDGLFKYDEQTGYYTFNSRENHAEYNKAENKFDLYNATITPNYIQYPFGNFLPFNSISAADTTRVAEIGRDDMSRMAAAARKKALDSPTGSVARRQYESLADAMAKFIALMDEENPGGWDSVKAAQKFNNWADNEYQSIFATMYNIDYDIPVDFHFGMSMELQFVQPENGKVKVTKDDGTVEEQNMIYRFSGDDDVWVFVDGKLLLDLSGIHTQVGGEIDFAAGEVRYYPYDANSAQVNFENPTTVKFTELGLGLELEDGIFKDYTTHTMNFYYLERGSGSSVCKIEFNLPVMPKNSIGVGKTLSQDTDAQKWLGDPDFTFQVLKADGDGKATGELFFTEGIEYRIYNSDFMAIGKGTVGAEGKFTLKAGQYAVFSDVTADKGQFVVRELLDSSVYEQYGEITAEGNATTVGADNVTIANVVYKGVDSPVQGISSNAEYTRVTFNNQAVTTRYGQLDITKEVETEETAPSTEKTFDIQVELDGEKLPKGTEYKVNGQSKSVVTAGIITLKKGETASITGLLAGTRYKVQETAYSAKDYSVTYKETTSSGKSAIGTDRDNRTYIEGTILPKPQGDDSATAAITVTNQDILTAKVSIEIPAKKILVNPDGLEHRYSFKIEQTDAEGNTISNGYSEEKEVTFTGNADTAEVMIPFTQIIYQARALFDTETNPAHEAKTFYYKVTETSQSDGRTLCDNSEYIVSVVISMGADNSLAQSVNIKKVGAAEGESVKEIVFANQLLHDLTIAKVMEGESGATGFCFLVKIADKDSLSVKGKTFDTYSDNEKKAGVTFDNEGKATVSVEAGKSLTIKGLPYGLNWEVTELNAEAYTASYVVGNAVLSREEALAAAGRTYARTVTGNQLTDAADTVTFINTVTYELPGTGGPGTILYTLAGIFMMLGACLLYRYMLKERRYRGV